MINDYHGTFFSPHPPIIRLRVCAAMGEVWGNILHNVYVALADAYGWAWEPVNPATPGGNNIFFQLLFDALLLQPCNPEFTQARDAWIQADANRYAGKNECLLWTAFASRGLGVKAVAYTDDATLPPVCGG